MQPNCSLKSIASSASLEKDSYMPKTKPFKQVMALNVFADFSQVEAGITPPPRVNHDKVDFVALREVLKNEFKYGPPVKLFVANDTIDQVTIHTRAGTVGNGVPDLESAMCRDFARVVLSQFVSAQNGVIDVRAAWQPLHSVHVRNRTFAPPPLILLFLVVAEDFEDAQFWAMNCRPSIGLKPFDMVEAVEKGPQLKAEEGKLSASVRASLLRIFGCPFEPVCQLYRLASDPAPAWARLEGF
jgi:hypothetical protein